MRHVPFSRSVNPVTVGQLEIEIPLFLSNPSKRNSSHDIQSFRSITSVTRDHVKH
jgi:hypothetical protein